MSYESISFEARPAATRALRVLFLGEPVGKTPAWLLNLGSEVYVASELFYALDMLNDDPADWALFVVDADISGGVERVKRLLKLLCERAQSVPVLIVSENVEEPVLPEDRGEAALLRAPLTMASLKSAFDHALRDRLGWTPAAYFTAAAS